MSTDIVETKDEANVVDVIHTPCKNCIFAAYSDRTQTGCKLNRVDKFRDQGCLVDARDEDTEFFIVNGRMCNAYQEAGWAFANQYPSDKWAEVIRHLIRLRLTIIVMFDRQNLDELAATARSIVSLEMPPQQVLIINNQLTKPPAQRASQADMHSVLWEIFGNKVTWRFQHILMEASKEKAIDLAETQIWGSFYSVFDAGAIVPERFIEKIDKALNDDLDRFSMLLPKDGQGLTVQTDLHRSNLISGNRPIEVAGEDGPIKLNNVVEKIQHYAQTQELPYFVKTLEEVLCE